MKRILPFLILPFVLFTSSRCTEQEKNEENKQQNQEIREDQAEPENNTTETEQIKLPSDFLPAGYVVFKELRGDLNDDNIEDCVLIIKGTNKSKIIKDEYRGELDRNRRGIIVLLKNKGSYELVVKNESCFSSENEDGGVYYAPELEVEIKKGKLYMHYSHGRYGFWKYTFRYKQNDFELIGFDQSENHGPIVSRSESYNFLTKKKLIKENINIDSEEPENEVFKDTWKNLTVEKLLQLSKIKDFDELEFSKW